MSRDILLVCIAVLLALASATPGDESSQEKRNLCRDRYPSCPNYGRFCQKSSWVRENCPRTCRACAKPTIPPCNPNNVESLYCPTWKRKGYCSPGVRYFYFMRDKCPGECGFCRGPKKARNKKKPTTQSKGSRIVKVNIQECLRAHNAYRNRHGAPPLKWNSQMAKDAQNYALKLAKIKKLIHASGIRHGENLAMRTYHGSSAATYTCEQATKDWYNEVKDYRYSQPGFAMATGHFTQVVWKSSELLGVGIARNGGTIVVVARYNPPGNYRGQFRENVLPKYG